jgi:arylsulfatase A-like enzyme
MTGDTADNVLLITYDSLRYDTWKQMQSLLTLGPELEEAGVSFDRAFATGPGTSPSFPGMLTGTLPLSYDGLGPLGDDRPRVAMQLQQRGFSTAGFHSNPFLSTHFNYDAGFDEFEDYQNPMMGVATKIFPRGIEINNPKLKRIDDIINLTGLLKSAYRQVSGKARPYVGADVITDDTIAWLKSTDSPFFCWAHYMDVHHPCYPPAEYRERFGVEHIDVETVSNLYSMLLDDSETLSDEQIDEMRALYRAAIVYVDSHIDRLVQTLKSMGRFENTLVVLTSDHGELFGEHGEYGKPERMYDELVQVPLVVVNGPDTTEGMTNELVSLLDLPPMFHEATGVEIPSEYEGQSLASEPREHVVAEHEVQGNPIVGVRSRNWLYEIDELRDEKRITEVKSSRRVDSLTQAEKEAVADIKRIAEQRVNQIKSGSKSVGEPQLNRDVEARLEDLGYR